MTIWDIVNSPVALTVIGLLWGSIVTTWITATWQKRAHQHEIKLECAKNILSIYHDYIRLLKGSLDSLSGKEFDNINARLYTEVKIAKLIFKNKDVSKQWKSVAGSLANIRQLRLEKSKLTDEKLDDVYDKATMATELMFKELT